MEGLHDLQPVEVRIPFLSQQRTTKEYRDRYLHASQCDRKNCNSRSCLKWQYFIHHLKNCPVLLFRPYSCAGLLGVLR